MKTTLLFLTLILGTLAIHVDVEKDEFWEDSDVEYFDLYESAFSDMDSDTTEDQTTTPPATTTSPTTTPTPTTTTATTPTPTPTTTTPTTTTTTTTASTTTTTTPTTTTTTTTAPTTTTTTPTTTTTLTPNSVNKGNGFNGWQRKISVSQQAALTKAYFKLYKELITADRKNDGTVSPPLSCQTVITEQKICFICPPGFGILKMFDVRCKSIPRAHKSGAFKGKEGFNAMSQDLYKNLRKMYLKFLDGSAEQLVENVKAIDFSVPGLGENATYAIIPSNIVSLPTSPTTSIQPIAGGYSFVETDDPDVRKILDFVVKELKTNNTDLMTSTYDFKSITSVEKQIVAGVNYKMDLEFINKENLSLYCSVEVSDNKFISESTPSLVSHSCV